MTMKTETGTSHLVKVVLACFFLSGLTGLIYEILWTRMIVKVIGCSPFAVSIVLTVFMAGLGVGSYVASRTIDRIKNPMRLVRVYGVLELAVGAYCFVLPVLLWVLRPLYAVAYNRLFDHFMIYNILTFVGCSLLLMIPVVCMGATLPILCRFYVTNLSHIGTHTGRLYGLNTIGAATGALVCGFWLINALGVLGTLVLAVSVNGLIGSFCVWASFRIKMPESMTQSERPQPVAAACDDGHLVSSITVIAALILFAVSGFCAMAYEVIWTKLLGLMVGPTTYSFTLVLVTFITCLALGSLFFGWLGDKVRRPIHLLIYTQLGAALFALLISHILGNSQLFFSKVLYHSKDHFAAMNVLKAVSLFAFMFLPTVLLGATFPLVGKIYTRSMAAVGRSIGVAYTVNTIGAVLGSFCAGFILIPMMGKEKGLSLVVALQITTCLAAAGAILIREKKALLRLLPVVGPALVGLVLCLHYPEWNRSLLSSGKYHRFDQVGVDVGGVGWIQALCQGPELLSRTTGDELKYYGDGIGGFTTVIEKKLWFSDPALVMSNSGKPDASTGGDMPTQSLLAHLPMLFHPNPKTVMVLGLASGITAGEVLHYPIDQLDVLEISPQVVEASKYFARWNNDVLTNPKTKIIVQDGRAHLQLTDRKYDVIISEPSNPWMAGLAALFTQEFFTAANDRLNEGGMFVQFMHSYQMDWSVFSMVGRTFVKVFPNSLFVTTRPDSFGPDYLFVGFKGKDKLIPENAQRRRSYAQLSKNITLTDPNVLYELVLGEALKVLFGEGPINTDSRPRLEFAAPRLMYHKDTAIATHLFENVYLTQRTADIRQRALKDMDTQIAFATYALSVGEQFSNMVDLSKASPSQKEQFGELMKAFAARYAVDYSLLQDEDLKRSCRLIQIEALNKRIAAMPTKNATFYDALARLYSDTGQVDEAIVNYKQALALVPTFAKSMIDLAWHLAVHKQAKAYDPQEAVRLAECACQLTNYRMPEVLDTLGAAYAAAGKFPLALAVAQEALRQAQSSKTTQLAEQIQKRVTLYTAGNAYVEILPGTSAP